MYHSNYLIGHDIESRRDAVPSKMFSVVVMIRMFFFLFSNSQVSWTRIYRQGHHVSGRNQIFSMKIQRKSFMRIGITILKPINTIYCLSQRKKKRKRKRERKPQRDEGVKNQRSVRRVTRVQPKLILINKRRNYCTFLLLLLLLLIEESACDYYVSTQQVVNGRYNRIKPVYINERG